MYLRYQDTEINNIYRFTCNTCKFLKIQLELLEIHFTFSYVLLNETFKYAMWCLCNMQFYLELV